MLGPGNMFSQLKNIKQKKANLLKITFYSPFFLFFNYTDKKENKIFLIYKEIQMGLGEKSCKRKGFLIYEEITNIFTIYEGVICHI